MPSHLSLRRFKPGDFAGWALIALLAVIWLAGGASRADVTGQFVVRGASWIVLLAATVFCARPVFADLRGLAWLLLATILLVLAQLVPLPPALWQSLPGRAAFAEAAAAIGETQPWRPLSLNPALTANAAGSLIVPATVFVLIAAARERTRDRMIGTLLLLTVLSMILGFIQFSSGGFDFPFVNDTPGDVNGNFANRNHFALFMAMGCLLAPAWAFERERHPRWVGAAALSLVPLFLMAILFSGSRTGLILGGIAVALAVPMAWPRARNAMRHAPIWAPYAGVALTVGILALGVFMMVATDKAAAIQRLVVLDATQDLRVRSLPTTMSIIQTYFPVGAGSGSFDPMFRMHEPLALLKPSYFNHAHNDFLEVALDTGLAGLLLLAAAVAWWGRSSLRAWRYASGGHAIPARLGSAILLLVAIASCFDYPARTPLIMAVIVLAASWQCAATRAERASDR